MIDILERDYFMPFFFFFFKCLFLLEEKSRILIILNVLNCISCPDSSSCWGNSASVWLLAFLTFIDFSGKEPRPDHFNVSVLKQR